MGIVVSMVVSPSSWSWLIVGAVLGTVGVPIYLDASASLPSFPARQLSVNQNLIRVFLLQSKHVDILLITSLSSSILLFAEVFFV